MLPPQPPPTPSFSSLSLGILPSPSRHKQVLPPGSLFELTFFYSLTCYSTYANRIYHPAGLLIICYYLLFSNGRLVEGWSCLPLQEEALGLPLQ